MLHTTGDPLNIVPGVLAHIFNIPITNTMTMAGVDFIFFVILMIAARSFTVRNPSKFQLAMESILEVITGLIKQITGNEKIAKKIMPIVVTLILFIMVSNLIMTFLPVLTGFTYNGVEMFRTHTSDFNTTLALSVTMIFLSQVYIAQKEGVFGLVFHYFQLKQIFVALLKKGIGGALSALIDAFVAVLDVVSEFAKVVSLSLRLFGNVFAGELLVGVLMSLFAIALPLPMIGLSMLSGVIQSIVFGALIASSYAGILKDDI